MDKQDTFEAVLAAAGVDRTTVLEAIDQLNKADDFLGEHWIEHDLGTGTINKVLCALLVALR